MLLGYACVSTDDQDLALQRAALREAGRRRLHEERVYGASVRAAARALRCHRATLYRALDAAAGATPR